MSEFRFYYFTSKYRETVGYYHDVLKFELFRAWDRGEGERGSVFYAPNNHGLIEIEEGTAIPIIQGGLYVQVDDADKWYKKLSLAGAFIVEPIADKSYGHRNFKIKDPSGLQISFFHYLVV
ncbi:MAG: VOC family protein [Flavobacteriales bacterium]